MIPLRLVVDTNIVVSAALKPEGPQRTVLLLALTKPARFFASAPILGEYADVISRSDLRIPRGLPRQLLQLIRNRCRIVKPLARAIPMTTSSLNVRTPPERII